MNFCLKEEKSKGNEGAAHNNDKSKQIEIHFYDIENQTDILHAISDVRNHSF